jgi:CoA:oxalate CoA-transferase
MVTVLPQGKSSLLSDVTILDLTMFVAGPFATAMLADLGARVIKVEPPQGDPTRTTPIGPVIAGTGAQFHTYNRGKQSIVLDLKSEAGRAVLDGLVANADVIIDNFRPGVIDRLGLGHDRLSGINPRIVSVSISAFGSTGSLARRAGYDLIVQALAGTMSITGHGATGPAHVPCHFGDTAAGSYAALACVSAVLEARRTGRGRALEVAMLDAQMAFLGDEVTFQASGDWQALPHEAGHPALAPYAAYQTADGSIAVAAVGLEKFWHGFLAAIERPDLAGCPQFADNGLRARNRRELDTVLAPILRARSTSEWLASFQHHDVPAAPVRTIAEAIASPEVAERACLENISVGEGQTACVPRSPIRPLGDGPYPVPGSSPGLGEHRQDVLSGLLGFTSHRIDELRQSGAFGPVSNSKETTR